VDGALPFIAVTVFARGLLNRLFTRVYLPAEDDVLAGDPFLGTLTPEDRSRLVARPHDDGGLRFDVHLQGEHETPFLSFPRHRG
jgi:protocatechuate 3,4-dioxygenase, alpha subunit